ncbi:hypothetical protein F7725_001790 [Dissostichus mawsoni]|uniref:Secreted protein n=1 Tax=Dissostichus mawsoni TaxID=36200 RepID=A0A7J5Y1I9_DISMA|nr:hypothetical protein F7725_001790 [Dissostichus mawsoni]
MPSHSILFLSPLPLLDGLVSRPDCGVQPRLTALPLRLQCFPPPSLPVTGNQREKWIDLLEVPLIASAHARLPGSDVFFLRLPKRVLHLRGDSGKPKKA